MPLQLSKRTLQVRALFGLGFIVVSFFSPIVAGAVFFITARMTSRIIVLNAISALVLLLYAGGFAWFFSRSVPFSIFYALIVLSLTGVIVSRHIFTPRNDLSKSQKNRSEARFWALETGSRIAFTKYRAEGSSYRPSPVVYLHGGPGIPTRTSNHDFFRRLTEDGYDVYLYDQCGTGQSDLLPDIRDYTVERNVADLESVRRCTGAERMVLIGTSWGAVLAVHYMAAYPGNVERAVLLSPGVIGDRSGSRYDHSRTASSEEKSIILPPLRLVVAGALARINPAGAQNFAGQAELNAIYDQIISRPGVEYQVNCKGYQPKGTGKTRAAGANYYANLLTLRSLKNAIDPQAALRSNNTPVLIMRGECDYIRQENALKYKESLPNAILLEVPQAGHALTSTQTEAVLATIRAFLNEWPLPIPQAVPAGR